MRVQGVERPLEPPLSEETTVAGSALHTDMPSCLGFAPPDGMPGETPHRLKPRQEGTQKKMPPGRVAYRSWGQIVPRERPNGRGYEEVEGLERSLVSALNGISLV